MVATRAHRAPDLLLHLEPGPASVPVARAAVSDAVRDRVSQETLATLRLLVTEVVSNALRHGPAGRPVDLALVTDGEVFIEVIDQGHGFRPPQGALDPEVPGGFGLQLVSTLARRWGIEGPDSTRVWFALARDTA